MTHFYRFVILVVMHVKENLFSRICKRRKIKKKRKQQHDGETEFMDFFFASEDIYI